MLKQGLLLASLVLPLTLALAAPAQASPDPAETTKATTASSGFAAVDTTCALGDLCFWVHKDKGGAKGRVAGNNESWGWNQALCGNGTWNNCASSIQNNGRSCDVFVYENGGYGGANLRINRGVYLSNLANHWITFPVDSWNDDIQSNKWIC